MLFKTRKSKSKEERDKVNKEVMLLKKVAMISIAQRYGWLFKSDKHKSRVPKLDEEMQAAMFEAIGKYKSDPSFERKIEESYSSLIGR